MMDGFFPLPPKDDADVATPARPSPRSRDSLFLLAQLAFPERGGSHEVRVRNLSPGGMMAEYDGPVSIGESLSVTVRGVGAVNGRVAWAAEGRIGISLDQPIDPKKARKPVRLRPSNT